MSNYNKRLMDYRSTWKKKCFKISFKCLHRQFVSISIAKLDIKNDNKIYAKNYPRNIYMTAFSAC